LSQTILCVDDDPITLMLYKKVIIKAEFGSTILFAQNGLEALELLKEVSNSKNLSSTFKIPDIIFLDLNMPVMNGWDFLEHFSKEFYPQFNGIKVVILSSTIDPSDYLKAKQYEAVTHFLSKPLTVEMLQELQ
jgi:CheY-like chemotaxis protein